MKMYDYTCTQCKHIEIDVLVNNIEDEVKCSICGNLMKREFPSCVVNTPRRGGIPMTNYKPGRGNAHFGKLKDGWY